MDTIITYSVSLCQSPSKDRLHFIFIVVQTLSIALIKIQTTSVIDENFWSAIAVVGICFLVAFEQAYVLFSVDGELYNKRKRNGGAHEAQPGVAGNAAPKSGAAPLN